LFAIIYALVYAGCSLAVPSKKRRASLFAVPAAIVLAVLSEAVQPFVGREFDFVDLLRDFAGTGIAWWFIEWWKGQKPRLANKIVGLVALVAGGYFTWDPVQVSKSILAAKGRFPIIYGGSAEEVRLWEFSDGVSFRFEQDRETTADIPILIEFQSDEGWPGATIHVQVEDWSAYRILQLRVRGDKAPFALGIRIDCAGGERHEAEFTVGGYVSDLEFEITGLTGVEAVRRLVFFVRGGEGAKRMFLQSIELR
jgi:hypothetical protein